MATAVYDGPPEVGKTGYSRWVTTDELWTSADGSVWKLIYQWDKGLIGNSAQPGTKHGPISVSLVSGPTANPQTNDQDQESDQDQNTNIDSKTDVEQGTGQSGSSNVVVNPVLSGEQQSNIQVEISNQTSSTSMTESSVSGVDTSVVLGEGTSTSSKTWLYLGIAGVAAVVVVYVVRSRSQIDEKKKKKKG